MAHFEHEEHNLFEVHSSEEPYFTINSEYGLVTSIEHGVAVDEEDQFIWPEQN